MLCADVARAIFAIPLMYSISFLTFLWKLLILSHHLVYSTKDYLYMIDSSFRNAESSHGDLIIDYISRCRIRLT